MELAVSAPAAVAGGVGRGHGHYGPRRRGRAEDPGAAALVLRAGRLVGLTTGSGAEALTLAVGGVDLVVLDLGLPDVPGETVATEIRRASATPILMLTARAGEEDRIRGLELGADDYEIGRASCRERVCQYV